MNLWNRRKAAVIFVLMVLIVGPFIGKKRRGKIRPRWILRQS